MKGLKKLYLTGIYSLYAQGKKNWCKDAKNLLYRCYNHEVYDSKNVLGISLSFILKTVETHLLLAYTDTWQTSVTTMPKLRTYKTFKSELKTEAYVKANVLNTR